MIKKILLIMVYMSLAQAANIEFTVPQSSPPQSIATNSNKGKPFNQSRWHELYDAVKKGDAAIVQKKLNTGAPTKKLSGFTILHAAVRLNNLEMVQLLLDSGLGINAKDKDDMIPLHDAAYEGHAAVVALLLEKGADSNAQDSKGSTPLHSAVYCGHVEVVKLLLKHGANIEAKAIDGRTPLHVAAGNGHIATVEVLLTTGADVNTKDKYGRTPLHYAAASKFEEIINQLIMYGADKEAKTNNGNTYLSNNKKANAIHKFQWHSMAECFAHAVKKGDLLTIFLLMKYGSIKDKNIRCHDALRTFACTGSIDIIGLFLADGANVNAQDRDGRTALHGAAYAGSKEMVEFLLTKGANSNTQDTNGYTPLHYAARKGDIEKVALLLKYDANSNAQDKYGYTPLHIAAKDGYVDIIKILLKNSADVNAQDKEGYTPLYIAAYTGQLEVVKLLLANGANAEIKDSKGKTALHIAAISGQLEVAKLLLINGANSNAQDSEGRTPLHVAADKGHLEVVRLLLTNGGYYKETHTYAVENGHVMAVEVLVKNNANVNAKDKKGRTPLHWATGNGHRAVVELLKQFGTNNVSTLLPAADGPVIQMAPGIYKYYANCHHLRSGLSPNCCLLCKARKQFDSDSDEDIFFSGSLDCDLDPGYDSYEDIGELPPPDPLYYQFRTQEEYDEYYRRRMHVNGEED